MNAASAELPLGTDKKDRRTLHAGNVETLLRKHFAPPHFAFLTQVRNGTGFSRKTVRTADAVAMGTWPSRGIHLHGIEVKVDYQDLKREIANPEKAEDIAKYCHFWWLAVTHEKVAPLAEVPAGWGLLIVHESDDKLYVAKQAEKLNPIPPDHLLLASLMRKMAEEYVHIDSLKDWRNEQRRELEAIATRNSKSMHDTAINALKTNRELMARIEKRLGCRLDEWNLANFEKDYALAMKIRESGKPIIDGLNRLIAMTENLKPALANIVATMEAAEEAPTP